MKNKLEVRSSSGGRTDKEAAMLTPNPDIRSLRLRSRDERSTLFIVGQLRPRRRRVVWYYPRPRDPPPNLQP
jgi:hypothetical protein